MLLFSKFNPPKYYVIERNKGQPDQQARQVTYAQLVSVGTIGKRQLERLILIICVAGNQRKRDTGGDRTSLSIEQHLTELIPKIHPPIFSLKHPRSYTHELNKSALSSVGLSVYNTKYA